MGTSNNSEGNISSSKKGLLQYRDDQKQVLFRIFGMEMTAPQGLRNPRIVYISFILINLILLIALKNFIST
ncbi:hypothetical protein EV05_0950 [Prochlorococcus sp. MIT 0601]|nr:hypothetical protein EV05_0950 [Prochlorococcus sp. MIT 0601]